MKKSLILSLILLLSIVILIVCSNDNVINDGVSKLPKVDAILSGKIVDINENYLLLAGESGLFSFELEGKFYDINGDIVEADAFKAGQIINIGFSGIILESSPAIPTGIEYIEIEKQQDDLIGLYLKVISDLWKVDSGLNADIDMIALDLSQASNLESYEKEALRYMMGNEYQLQILIATYDELVEEGLIDDENLYFERGLLINLVVKDVKSDAFSFDISKWRSGLGAYFFIDCKAKLTNNGWTYEIGSEAIS